MLNVARPAVIRLSSLVLAGFGLLACGEEPAPVSGDQNPVYRTPDGGSVQCLDYDTKGCACSDGRSGLQSCYQGAWLLCNCDAPTPPVATSNAGSCLPGRYEGNFLGLYFSSYNFAGIPIPVTGADLKGLPPLVLTLEQQVTSSGLEFSTYEVRDGYVKGTADGLFPFEGKITGTLDCNTKIFTGEFDGWYALLIDQVGDLNKGFFKGPVSAVYDGVTHEFKMGKWDVKEYKGNPVPGYGIVLTELGGGGSWDAKYGGPGSADAGVAVPDAGP